MKGCPFTNFSSDCCSCEGGSEDDDEAEDDEDDDDEGFSTTSPLPLLCPCAPRRCGPNCTNLCSRKS